MLQTGLRVSEVAGLRRADLVIHDRSGSIRVRLGKGRKERLVPLNATARRALTSYLDARDHVKPDDAVFESERGKSMSVRSIQQVVSELARRAKVTRTRVSAHTLRHTFALGYLRSNPGRLVELANLLGHESVDTTAIYTQPSIESLAESLERSSLNACPAPRLTCGASARKHRTNSLLLIGAGRRHEEERCPTHLARNC
jgi:integrase/recombinase XerC